MDEHPIPPAVPQPDPQPAPVPAVAATPRPEPSATPQPPDTMAAHPPVPSPKKAPRTNPEMDKLKELWINLSNQERDEWQKLFASQTPQREIRALLLARYQVDLPDDKYLTRFRGWIEWWADRECERERMRIDQEEIARLFPHLNLDEARDELLKRAYARAVTGGNFDLGLRTIRVHTGVKNYELSRARFQFDAAATMQRIYPQVRVIQRDDTLSDREKINRIRRRLFGRLPGETVTQ